MDTLSSGPQHRNANRQGLTSLQPVVKSSATFIVMKVTSWFLGAAIGDPDSGSLAYTNVRPDLCAHARGVDPFFFPQRYVTEYLLERPTSLVVAGTDVHRTS